MSDTALEIGKTFSAALVLKKHPDYDRMKPHWEFVETTYRGGRDWFDSNIFQYMKEGRSEFEDRLKRAYRFNHTREVVDMTTKHIFRSDILRDEAAPTELQNFWANATKGGQGIRSLMSAASTKASIYGMAFMVVDMTRPPEGVSVVTVEDQKAANLRPFAYVVKPQDVLDMSFDDDGRLNWILIRETERDDSDFFKNAFVNYDVWRLWTKTGWMKFKARSSRGKFIPTISSPKTDRVEIEDMGEHNLGMVPVIPFTERGEDMDSDYHAPGLIDDIAYLDRAVANYLSNLDAIIQDQTFSQLVIPAQALMPGTDEYESLLAMGTKRVFAYDADGNTRGPEYIAPDPKQATIIMAVITKIITEIYHSIGLAGERTKMDNAVGIDNSSGVAKAYDFERMNAMLAQKASRLEKLENDMAKLVMAWHGDMSYADDPVKYPQEFDTRDLYDEFEIAERLFLFQAPDELRRQQIMRLVDKLYPQLRADLRTKIENDAKQWPVDPLAQMQVGDSQSGDSRQGQVTAETP